MNSKIGIFWIYDNQIFYETQNLNELETISGCVDSDLAHYKVWDNINKQHPKFYLYEYEDIPRGRVIYNKDFNKFVVYCNSDILKNETSKSLILKAFGLLDKNVLFKEDEHYKILKYLKSLYIE